MTTSSTVRQFTGRVWKYGDNVNTDVIFPGKYTYTLKMPEEIAAHALEDLDPGFAASVQTGDIVVAGSNWGMRLQPRTGRILSGPGRGARRRCPELQPHLVSQCPEQRPARPWSAQPSWISLPRRDTATISLNEGCISTEDGRSAPFEPLSADVLRILDAGGLIPYIKQQMAG